MTQTLARIIPILRPSQRKIAVAAIANKSYDQGWKDREALYAAEQSGVPARPAA